jgi:transcriptional regulator
MIYNSTPENDSRQMSYKEIAKIIGMTQQGVQALEKRALTKIQRILRQRFGIKTFQQIGD